MLTASKLPIFIAVNLGMEAGIYYWSAWTATLEESNLFFIEPSYVFDKCARISGRVSAVLNVMILFMIAWFGLKEIYAGKMYLDMFQILITLFAVNHLIHFFYLYQNFKQHALLLKPAENKHGIFTTVCILLVPVILWSCKHVNGVLYSCLLLHLFNVSYIIIDIFNNKIKQGNKAYHNKLGILVTSVACLCVLYRIFSEY